MKKDSGFPIYKVSRSYTSQKKLYSYFCHDILSWWCTPGGVIVCVCVHDGLMFPHPWDSLGGGGHVEGGGGGDT